MTSQGTQVKDITIRICMNPGVDSKRKLMINSHWSSHASTSSIAVYVLFSKPIF